MRPVRWAILTCLLFSSPLFAQHKPAPPTPSVWSVQVGFSTEVPGRYRKAVFTPRRNIVITRVEAFGESGPKLLSNPDSPPMQCPLQYSLELKNRVTGKTVPISNKFLKETAASTYTDSGPLKVGFWADNPIVLSLIVPVAQGNPPPRCESSPIAVTVHYELDPF